MATRSLTEVFILMRNNALQNRHIFSEQVSKLFGSSASTVNERLLASASTTPSPPAVADDRQALVSHEERDIELGLTSRSSRLPPEWVDGVEEIQFEITRIKMKMKELSSLHDKHLNRPTLDDSIDEEHAISIQTHEITQLYSRCQQLVQQINSKSRQGTDQEQKLTRNVVSSLALTVQELSTSFRTSQSNYLKKLKVREERSRQYFGDSTDLLAGDGYVPDELDALYDRGFTTGQMQMVEDNTMMIQHREREISQIVRSIQDLNEIFKDLGNLVVDQGTVLDRIDYNVEQTSMRVDKGLEELQKASKYQKKNRKMLIIVILFVIVIVMIIILLALKS